MSKLKAAVVNEPESLLAQYYQQDKKRKSNKSFKMALTKKTGAVIAEIKRKSPSKEHLADIVNPVALANQYVTGGAAVISVLTDKTGFNGSIKDLCDVAKSLTNIDIPVLRKDFIIDAVQIAESIVAGADAILLIVKVLGNQTEKLLQQAKASNIDAVVEVHDQQELEYALEIGAEIIGVNNRDLTTFKVDVNNAKELIKHFPSNVIKIAESGISDLATAHSLLNVGYDALLIGEALVKADNPESYITAIREKTCQAM